MFIKSFNIHLLHILWLLVFILVEICRDAERFSSWEAMLQMEWNRKTLSRSINMLKLKPDDFMGRNDATYWASVCVRCYTECFIDSILFHIHRSLDIHTSLFSKLWKFIWIIQYKIVKWPGLNSIPKWITSEHMIFQKKEVWAKCPFLPLALIWLSLNISFFSLSTWQPVL